MTTDQLLPPPSGVQAMLRPPPTLPTLSLPRLAPVLPTPPPTPRAVQPPMPMIPAKVVAKRTKRRRWRRVLAGVVILGGISGATSGILGKLSQDDELPTYLGARPVYGSVVFSLDETAGTEVTKATITTDSNASVVHMVTTSDSTSGSVDMIVDGVNVYALTPDSGGWMYFQDDDPGAFRSLAAIARVFIFEDLVPEVARPFFHVRSTGDRHVDGRALTRYELILDELNFERKQPGAYAAWVTRIDPDGDFDARYDRSQLVLWLDNAGVVWQLESHSDFTSDASTMKVVSFTPDVFVPPYPTSYLDMINGGVQVNG